MHLNKRPVSAAPWLGVMLGLLVCSLPLVALAVEFRPPRRGLPGRREGGGTRDPLACIQGKPAQLTAVIPQTNLGLTTAAYPRFFWFMPKTSPRVKYAEFTLTAVNENLEDTTPVYTSTFRISGTPGIASLALPADATIPPLEMNKDYRWSVSILCNPNNSKQNITVTGWVQRVAPGAEFAGQLARSSSHDRAALYAKNGYWFDTLTILAAEHCAKPNDSALATSWSELMKSVNLEAIATQPLVQQCGQEK